MTAPIQPATTPVLDYSATAAPRARPAWVETLGWAGYLGSSWTWCIGMFLPVLLVRDYGLAGWWSFAIPNVVGAAAMGWVIRSRHQGLAMIESHRPAIRAFSFVTIAFHAFFFSLIFFDLPWTGMEVIALVLLLFVVVGRNLERTLTSLALVISGLLAVWALFKQFIPHVIQREMPHPIRTVDFASLSAVMVFGFLLCPYLDQTFHRARQETDDRHAKWAFGLGFGAFFAAMIVFTVSYSGWILPGYGQWAGGTMALILMLHFSVQALVTMSLHWPDATRQGKPAFGPITVFSGCVALAFGFGIWSQCLKWVDPEIIYRLFLGPYALVFPAYVLICMQPWKKVTAVPSVRQWIFFAGAVLLAGPFFLMGITGDNRLPMFCGLLVVLVMAAAERVLPAIAMRKGRP